ncbi:hypothetical protein [Nocardioides jensenii]|uniref:hypothetical protein n=1 Tax=Nocardioides jensenii TaxID=1843 RepID=UPI000B0ECCA0|nr:hypothetical protein [Nocardioides jensenii]
MNQFPNNSTGSAGITQAHPVVALRDQLTQTRMAAKQLRSILATVDDPGRRFGEIR